MKNIPIFDLFYKVALDTARPLLETKDGNRYALVAINHYSKWCEANLVKDQDVITTARFLEEEIICRFGVPRFILIDNGGDWMAEFDMMYKKYGIIHQFIAPQWPQCNGMVERMIKTLKNGLFVVSFTNLDNWDI
jgi:transposase-like protein